MNLLLFEPAPDNAEYDHEQASRFFQPAKERVSALPGIKHVSFARHLMLTDPLGWMTQRATIPDIELPPDVANVAIRFNAVDPGYFQTLSTHLLVETARATGLATVAGSTESDRI